MRIRKKKREKGKSPYAQKVASNSQMYGGLQRRKSINKLDKGGSDV